MLIFKNVFTTAPETKHVSVLKYISEVQKGQGVTFTDESQAYLLDKVDGDSLQLTLSFPIDTFPRHPEFEQQTLVFHCLPWCCLKVWVRILTSPLMAEFLSLSFFIC